MKPTKDEARKFHRRFDTYGDVLKTPGYGGPSRAEYQGLDNDAYFKAQHPRYPDWHYPDDKDADTRSQFTFATLKHYGARPVMKIGEKELNYLDNKQNARALLDFKQFVEDSIPRGTPWAREHFDKFMPGWYKPKMEIIAQKELVLKKFIEITVRGVESQEDMWLLYHLYQGNLELPDNIEHLMHPDSQTITAQRFHAGKYNPRMFVDKKIMISRRNQDFMANFAISGIDTKGAIPNDDNIRILLPDGGTTSTDLNEIGSVMWHDIDTRPFDNLDPRAANLHNTDEGRGFFRYRPHNPYRTTFGHDAYANPGDPPAVMTNNGWGLRTAINHPSYRV